MDITKRLLELDPTLQRHNEGFWQVPYNPSAGSYSSFNDAGVEIETGEFLYAITRLLKPKRVLETGTHIGVGAAYMGMALKDNLNGHLDTIEFLPEIHQRAKERMIALGLEDQVTCHFGDAANFDILPKNQIGKYEGYIEPLYKLILLDTEPQTRYAELVKFYPYLQEGGFIFIHDLHQHMHQIPNEEHGFAWPFGKIPKAMSDLITSGKLRPFHFATPRGLTGFYRVAEQDYKW